MGDRVRWPERVYWAGGLGGLLLVGVAFWLAHDRATTFMYALVGLSCVVIIAWMLEGLGWHRRQRRARVEAEAAAARDRARQEESRRALQETLARRTVSHGGVTINVHKVRTRDGGRGGQA